MPLRITSSQARKGRGKMETLKYELEMQELITMREGFIAENKNREMNGQALAYGEQVFIDLSERFANLQVRYLRQE